MRVGNVELTRLPGGIVQLLIPTDNVPAVARLDRGEAFMVADAIRDMARVVNS